MKRIISIFSIVLTLLASGSCEDFDPRIYGSLTEKNFPVSESDFEAQVMTCYIPFVNIWAYSLYASLGNQHPWYIPSGGVVKMFDVTSDVMSPWNSGVWGIYYRLLSSADFSMCKYAARDVMSDELPNNYPKVREVTRFTNIIASLMNSPSDKITAERRNEFIAEARLLRGLHMYNLFHVYGPVPLIVNVDDIHNSEALNDVERPSLDEITQWIYDDFEFAVENMPEKQTARSRFTCDFARVMLMRHCLNEGSHMDGYYDKAIEMYRQLDKGKYSLFTSGENPYVEMFREKNDFNCEIIAAISCDPSATGNTKEGSMNPFAMLATPNNAAKKDDLGNPTPFAIAGPGWGMTFNLAPKFYDTFEDLDLRKESIITRYYTATGEWLGPEDIGRKAEWDGYVPYKYPEETATAPCFGNDIPLARWADVLLMFAEAEVRKSGAAPTAEAVAAVNQVRKRAGLADLPASCTSSQEAFLDAILTERGHEFWYEGMRKIDLIRFNKYAQACKASKGVIPTHQYYPIPNYAIEEASAIGKNLEQEYSRDGWEEDLSKAGTI